MVSGYLIRFQFFCFFSCTTTGIAHFVTVYSSTSGDEPFRGSPSFFYLITLLVRRWETEHIFFLFFLLFMNDDQ